MKHPLQIKTIIIRLVLNRRQTVFRDKPSVLWDITTKVDEFRNDKVNIKDFISLCDWHLISTEEGFMFDKRIFDGVEYHIPFGKYESSFYRNKMRTMEAFIKNDSHSLVASASRGVVTLIEIMEKDFAGLDYKIVCNISYTGTGSRKLSKPFKLFYESGVGVVD